MSVASRSTTADEELADDLFASLPSLPSLDNYESRLASLQDALDNVRTEAEAELPDDLFANLPDLPNGPSINAQAQRLAEIQDALNDARVEAASIRSELREKAELLRKLAKALEAV